ncbi:MAG: acetylornithine/succinylornithine family transaminase [Planctomycetota bacterium]|jgi:acetylornithine/N-succinyldiaminopimelate aminotransferase|nr:acetylornithine/succinylornithine family transaminase [Planctomycetota bacterium]
MTFEEIERRFADNVIANYARQPICIVRGAGSRVWDSGGRSYLDLFPGWGVGGLGHCHPGIVAAIQAQAAKLIHVANHFYSEEQGAFAEAIVSRAPGFKVFFCNSGAEANEAAIKLARLSHQPKFGIVAMERSFHGRTLGAVSATGHPEYRKGFEPTVPGFAYAKMNDVDSVKELVDDKTCAIMVEPVQGEGGVIPATREFLEGLRGICDQHGLALIFDEVQTAPCRLGAWFGYQRYGVTPDILTAAKAIAGGMPMAAMLAKPELSGFLKPGTHGSTFGGHSLGCAAGVAAFKIMAEEDIIGNVITLGAWLDGKLAGLSGNPRVKATRRAGFMVGIELDIPGADVVSDCRDNGLLINCTHRTVLRLLPALNSKQAELEEGLAILSSALDRAAERDGAG